MLSNTCKTAIKAVIYLSSKFDTEENAGIKEISEFINANEHTVGKILQTLVKQNVIKSLKGPSGGFYISKEQQKQPIINIVEAIDGKQIFKACGFRFK
ncbi:MAG TPA: Rrf2 family transcriptional regulator [Hanamia sp.]